MTADAFPADRSPDEADRPSGVDQLDYQERFQHALGKAFAARSADVRNAYFDLASFYREKLAEPADLCPLAAGYRDLAAGRSAA